MIEYVYELCSCSLLLFCHTQCAILTEESFCGFAEDCKWDSNDGCMVKKPVCPDYDNKEDCAADVENSCAWDVTGECDEEADLLGCLVSAEYLQCMFAETFGNFTDDFESLAEERACACSVSQLSCLGAADCFSYYDDLLAQSGLEAEGMPGLCEATITAFTESFDSDSEDNTCNDICEQDFGYTSGNTTFAMVITLDEDIDDDKLEMIIANGIVGLEATDVTVTRTNDEGNSAIALQASEVTYNVDINIPAGRAISPEGLAKIQKDLEEIEDNEYIKQQTGAEVTVDGDVEASVAGVGTDKTSSASGLAISVLSMAVVMLVTLA